MIQPFLPQGLQCDTLNGVSYVSIVPFKMSGIRFRFLPKLPFTSLWELNIRTYVRHQHHSGIYFFTLDSTHRLGNWIARRFFHLPYRYAKLTANISSFNDQTSSLRYSFSSPGCFALDAQTQPLQNFSSKEKSEQGWLTERYSFFTEDPRGRLLRGEVMHDPWPLEPAEVLSLQNSFTSDFGIKLEKGHIRPSYAKELQVRFRPFECVR
jgi:hypothetical protein